jgi:hypothetical protein
MRNQHRLGEAAGIAASLCVQLGTSPRALDVRLLQGELRENGALLPAGEQREPVVQPRTVEQAVAELTSDLPNVLKDAVWTLAHGGPEASAALRDFVKSGPVERRFWAALALAWQRDDAALPELIRAVETRLAERADYTPRSRNQRPFWQSCVVMLGRIGSPAAVPALLDVLADPTSDLDQLIAAVRALSRIGDARAVPALERLLARDDAPRERRFQATKASSRWPEREDGLWQLELAVAEVLARFGRPQPEVVQCYLSDPRNQPRRYARIVAAASGLSVDGPIGAEVRPGVARLVEDRAFQEAQVSRNNLLPSRELRAVTRHY